MARGDARDLFLRKMRLSGVDKAGAKALADRLDALEAADSAASGVGLPGWFESSGVIPPGHAASFGPVPTWAPITDGVAASVDVIVDPADVTGATLKVVTPGIFLISGKADTAGSANATAGTMSAYLELNADAQGPLYYMTPTAVVGPDGTSSAIFPGMPVVLAANDKLRMVVSVNGSADMTVQVTGWLTVLKVADPPLP